MTEVLTTSASSGKQLQIVSDLKTGKCKGQRTGIVCPPMVPGIIVRDMPSLLAFRRELKTVLFRLSYTLSTDSFSTVS